MRIRLLISLAVVVACGAVFDAQQWTYQKTAAEVTVAGTAIDLFTDADVEAGAGHPAATLAVCTLTGANIRIAADQNPTTSLGIILTPGQYTVYGSAYMAAVKGIRDDSTSATWNCSVFGQ